MTTKQLHGAVDRVSFAVLTVNTVGSCAELLAMSTVCSLQATQPARLSSGSGGTSIARNA